MKEACSRKSRDAEWEGKEIFEWRYLQSGGLWWFKGDCSSGSERKREVLTWLGVMMMVISTVHTVMVSGKMQLYTLSNDLFLFFLREFSRLRGLKLIYLFVWFLQQQHASTPSRTNPCFTRMVCKKRLNQSN